MASGIRVADRAVDAQVGLRVRATESQMDVLSLIDLYGARYTFESDHPWVVHAALWRELACLRVRSVLDLGCGYGRLLIFGALRHAVRGVGIEIVAERVREAQRASRALGLRRIDFLCGDVLRSAWPSTDCVCVMNPVGPVERPDLVNRLRREATRRRFFVAAISILNLVLAEQAWLRPVSDLGADPLGVRVYMTT